MLRQFDLCTMVSNQDRDQAVDLLDGSNTRVEVIPNGVDCQWNKPGIAEIDSNTLVFNGSLTYEMNFEAMDFFLKHIYPQIKGQNKHANLWITGSTNGVPLNKLNVDESVKFTGFMPDIRATVSSASVCVVPLLRGGGTRLKILEAMALGTPVVATSKAAEGIDVDNGHDIIIADRPGSFAKRTLQLLEDLEKRQKIAKNARRLVVERYDWSSIGRRFADLVEETISNQPKPTHMIY